MLDLNEKGFINGHTPFSTVLAFISYFISYLLSKKYIVVLKMYLVNLTFQTYLLQKYELTFPYTNMDLILYMQNQTL